MITENTTTFDTRNTTRDYGLPGVGYLELAKAIVKQALRDAFGGGLPSELTAAEKESIKLEAQLWLIANSVFIRDLGFDSGAIAAWILMGAPTKAVLKKQPAAAGISFSERNSDHETTF